MKKIVKISSLILLSILCMITNVYAASCDVSLQPSSNSIAKDTEFSVNVNMSNIQTDNAGIIIFSGKLDYDKSQLTLLGMEGQNSWSTPSYNEANGMFACDRGSQNKSNETIFKMKFKLNSTATSNPTIKLTNIIASDGADDIKAADATKTITISGGTKPITPPDDTDNNGGDVTNPPTTNTVNPDQPQEPNAGADSDHSIKANTSKDQKEGNAMKKGILPKAGATNVVVIVLGAVGVLAIFFYIRMKVFDRNMK